MSNNETLTHKQLKIKRLADLIRDNAISDLSVSTRDLCVFTFQTLHNIKIDVRFFKSEAVSLVNRMYSYARLYEIERKEEYLDAFKIKLEDLRSNFRMMFELKIIGQGSTYKMCKAFNKVDEEFNKLIKHN